MRTIVVACLIILLAVPAIAGSVQGYTRSDGTYVQPHMRSNPNNTVKDNYDFKGNVNPYTGQTGNNNYPHSPSSPYYNGPKSPFGND